MKSPKPSHSIALTSAGPLSEDFGVYQDEERGHPEPLSVEMDSPDNYKYGPFPGKIQ